MLREDIGHAALDREPAVMAEPAIPRAPERSSGERPDWQTVDRALRAIGKRRAGLDAEEARWLREAEALQIWRPLGMVSALDYLERVLGYAPRTAHDRLRVARALGDLPRLTAALAGGAFPFSAVRELTRVATPATEAAWVAAAAGKNLRQVEELVADHHPGDRPDDPPDPSARSHVVRFELSAETFALMRQARAVIDDEHGTNLSDDAFIAAVCSAALDAAPLAEPTGRARFQIAVTVCERCRQGWQDGAGAQISLEPAAVERAMCDAQHIGSIDGAAPERSYQDIAPSVARFVWRRDHGRCRVDGCRSARGLELHHIVHREHGGGHEASNIILLCSSCHLAHHRGALLIAGTAEQLEIRRPSGASSMGAHDLHTATAAADSAAHLGAASARTELASDRSGLESVPAADSAAHVGAANVRTELASDRTSQEAGTVADSAAHVGAASAWSGVANERASRAAAADSTAHVGAAGAPTGIADETANQEAGAAGANAIGKVGGACVIGKLDAAILRTQAKAALVGLGWKPAIASAAVAAAAARAEEWTLERLIFESLRECPVRRA